jgi:hypothetical protein
MAEQRMQACLGRLHGLQIARHHGVPLQSKQPFERSDRAVCRSVLG